MQRNKYLEELGIPLEEYGTNFMKDDDRRAESWKEERDLYGFDSRETWNLDQIFIEWLYSHLMMYKERTCVNLSFHKFDFDGKEVSQEEAIDFIIETTKQYLITDEFKRDYEKVNKAVKLFADIMNAMWW